MERMSERMRTREMREKQDKKREREKACCTKWWMAAIEDTISPKQWPPGHVTLQNTEATVGRPNV